MANDQGKQAQAGQLYSAGGGPPSATDAEWQLTDVRFLNEKGRQARDAERLARLLIGEAGCASRVIHGAPDASGVRRGRIIVAEVPDRSVVLVQILSDGDSMRVDLDAAGFQAMRDVFATTYTSRDAGTVDPPVAKKPVDVARELLEDLAAVADASPTAPIELRAAAAAAIEASLFAERVARGVAPVPQAPTRRRFESDEADDGGVTARQAAERQLDASSDDGPSF